MVCRSTGRCRRSDAARSHRTVDWLPVDRPATRRSGAGDRAETDRRRCRRTLAPIARRDNRLSVGRPAAWQAHALSRASRSSSELLSYSRISSREGIVPVSASEIPPCHGQLRRPFGRLEMFVSPPALEGCVQRARRWLAPQNHAHAVWRVDSPTTRKIHSPRQRQQAPATRARNRPFRPDMCDNPDPS